MTNLYLTVRRITTCFGEQRELLTHFEHLEAVLPITERMRSARNQNTKGIAYALVGETLKARQSFEQSSASDSARYESLYNLSQVLKTLDEDVAANAALNRAVDVDSSEVSKRSLGTMEMTSKGSLLEYKGKLRGSLTG